MSLRLVTRDDQTVLGAVLARAFDDDPVQRWVFPRERARRTRGAAFFRWSLKRLVAQEASWTTPERNGAAVWALPGQWKETPAESLRLVVATGPGLILRAPQIIGGLTEIERRHPEEPHLYLALLGVDPDHQGGGLGSRLIAPGLALCDEERLPAYLETGKERNLAFYARHGFRVVEAMDLPRGPRIWRLWRDPR